MKLVNNDVANVKLSAKECAFMSKDLATIKTDIPEVDNISLDSLIVNIDKDRYNEKMSELEMKSLLKK